MWKVWKVDNVNYRCKSNKFYNLKKNGPNIINNKFDIKHILYLSITNFKDCYPLYKNILITEKLIVRI